MAGYSDGWVRLFSPAGDLISETDTEGGRLTALAVGSRRDGRGLVFFTAGSDVEEVTRWGWRGKDGASAILCTEKEELKEDLSYLMATPSMEMHYSAGGGITLSIALLESQLFLGSSDHAVRQFDVATGKLHRIYHGSGGGVTLTLTLTLTLTASITVQVEE